MYTYDMIKDELESYSFVIQTRGKKEIIVLVVNM